MRHCILHIGGHKTGSSAIQQLFMEHESQLASRGVLYPLRGKTTGTQRNLFYEMAGNKQFDPEQPTWAWLEESLRKTDCDILVLSSEIFSTLPKHSRMPAKIERFFRKLDFSVQVVAYVRPQHELVNSMYAQRLRLLNSDQSFARWAPRELSHRLYHYESLFQPWDRSGRFFLTVLPYAGPAKEYGALQDFIANCGLQGRLDDSELAKRRDRRNVTPGPKTIEALRRLAAGGGRRKYRKKLRDLRNYVIGQSSTRGWNEDAFNGVSDRMRARIVKRFQRENRSLSQQYFLKGWKATFSQELREPLVVNEFDRKTASKQDEQELAEFVEEVKARFGAGAKSG